MARVMFDSLLVLSIRQPSGPSFELFKQTVLEITNSTFIDDDIQFNLIVTGGE